MNKFCLKNKVEKQIISTSYGLVAINNIVFDPLEIENYLPNIIFDDNNLKFMFQQNKLNTRMRRLILNRFIPNDRSVDLTTYVQNSLSQNKNFYSFLAEGMLTLIFRDINNYELATGILDVTNTLNDTHSGVDACMFDRENSVLVLGEAKFYRSFKEGIEAVFDDFKNKKILNKIDSFKRNSEYNEESEDIIIKNLCTNNIMELTLQEFVNQNLIFVGFVLHNSLKRVDTYLKEDFYNDLYFSVDDLKNKINKNLNTDVSKCKYEVFLFHLPINDKKELIEKIITRAEEDKKKLAGERKTNG